jgi:glycogen operon protein
MKNIKTSSGNPLLLGATKGANGVNGVNFAIFGQNCRNLTLLLFKDDRAKPLFEVNFDPKLNRHGDIWHIMVEGDLSGYHYAYKMYPENHKQSDAGDGKDDGILAMDPYCRYLSGGEVWGQSHNWLGAITNDNFDWQGDRPLERPMSETIIYELHVRGFTRHKSSGVRHPGTYQALVEKIPYLNDLGVTAVELLPINEFDENENSNRHPRSGKRLKNFWGYSPLAFFAPKTAYADIHGDAVREFKNMVRELHRADIEVILDVVFNHTGEAHAESSLSSFSALAESVYYLKDPLTGEHLNFTGCGNTVNCNNPVVRRMIIDCLRYWVVEMHVDGFRFDLASIFSRDQQGELSKNPPLVEEIAADPVLRKTKIIAEAWDAAGLYQVGSFSNDPHWSEWNGRFRDDVRAFLCGHEDGVARLATRLAGSADLYEDGNRNPGNSVNFITSHDGFTLCDLVSYNQKHNEENGENNQDGENHNISWNSGKEGNSKARKVVSLRERRIRTAALILLLSQGTPMLLAGDEFGRSQGGNNNAYCQDNDISWLNWELADKNKGLRRFFRYLISLRKNHPVFRRESFFDPLEQDIIWQGAKKGEANWAADAQKLCFMLAGKGRDNDFFVAINGSSRSKAVELPDAPSGEGWRLIVDTAALSPDDIVADEQGVSVRTGKITIRNRSAMVLMA